MNNVGFFRGRGEGAGWEIKGPTLKCVYKARNLSKVLLTWPETFPLCSQKPVFCKLTRTALRHVFLCRTEEGFIKLWSTGICCAEDVNQCLINYACKHRQPPWLLALGFKLSPAPLASFKSCQQHSEESLWDTAKTQAGNITKRELDSPFSTECFPQLKKKKGKKKRSGIWINLLDFDLQAYVIFSMLPLRKMDSTI